MGMDAELIARISPEHRDRLAWFEEHQGEVLPAPGGRLMGRPRVSPAKGIYKPADLPMRWADIPQLSIRDRCCPSGLAAVLAAVAAERY